MFYIINIHTRHKQMYKTFYIFNKRIQPWPLIVKLILAYSLSIDRNTSVRNFILLSNIIREKGRKQIVIDNFIAVLSLTIREREMNCSNYILIYYIY